VGGGETGERDFLKKKVIREKKKVDGRQKKRKYHDSVPVRQEGVQVAVLREGVKGPPGRKVL